MDICFWCKRPKGDEDGKPEYFDYEFCNDCEKKVDKGITIIETVETPNENPPIKTDLYPTGKWVVVKEDAIKEVLSEWVGLEDVVRTGIMYIDKDTWERLGLP